MSSLLQVLIIILGIQWSLVFGAKRGNKHCIFAGLLTVIQYMYLFRYVL